MTIKGGIRMPLIVPSADLRNNYNKISKKCHETKEPIFITKNGANDLVVLSDEAFENIIKKNMKNEEERIERLVTEKFEQHYQNLEEFKNDLYKNIAVSLKEMEDGNGIPMEQLVAEMEEKYNIGG